MATSAFQRLEHIKERIQLIRQLFAAPPFDDAKDDAVRWPAFERHIEVVSEASRHVPEDWEVEHGPQIEWQRIAGIGSVMRHVYQRVNAPVLWDIYLYDLDPLEAAVDRMMAANSATPPESPSF